MCQSSFHVAERHERQHPRKGGSGPGFLPGDRRVSEPEFTEELLAHPLPKLPRFSVTDPVRLRTAIEQAQVSGMAYQEQEAALGVSCIAARVFDGAVAVAALSVAVPRERFRPAQLAPAVRTAALGLSRVLRTFAEATVRCSWVNAVNFLFLVICRMARIYGHAFPA